MQLTPNATRTKTETHALSSLCEADEDGVRQLTGRVLSIANADPAYGADAGTRLAFVCHEMSSGQSAVTPLALSREQSPTLAVGYRVKVWGVEEPLTVEMSNCTVAMGVLAVLDIHPI